MREIQIRDPDGMSFVSGPVQSVCNPSVRETSVGDAEVSHEVSPDGDDAETPQTARIECDIGPVRFESAAMFIGCVADIIRMTPVMRRIDALHHVAGDKSEADQRKRLYAAMAGLDERSQAILRERWLTEKKQTLQELAQRFGVSAERIRQIEKAAINKLKIQLQW